MFQRVHADEVTSQHNRVNYVRLLVEVDLAKELVEQVQVQRVNGCAPVKMTREWRPKVPVTPRWWSYRRFNS